MQDQRGTMTPPGGAGSSALEMGRKWLSPLPSDVISGRRGTEGTACRLSCDHSLNVDRPVYVCRGSVSSALR